MGTKIPERDAMLLLGTLAGHELEGKCRCGRTRRFNIGELASFFGPRVAYPRLARRLRCRACGNKGIELKLILHRPTPAPFSP